MEIGEDILIIIGPLMGLVIFFGFAPLSRRAMNNMGFDGAGRVAHIGTRVLGVVVIVASLVSWF